MLKKTLYNYLGPINLQVLALAIDGTLITPVNSYNDIRGISIKDIKNIEDAVEGDLTFISNSKYLSELASTGATACIVPDNLVYDEQITNNGPWLIKCKNPYYSYSKALVALYSEKRHAIVIDPSAKISPSSKIADSVTIGPNVVIEEEVTIGKGTIIEANSIIKQGVIIGADCHIGALCTIAYSNIGNRVIIYTGARIGNDGFGFATFEGKHHKILHIGQVVIGNDVEIGANTTIDRGSNRNTIIGNGCVIDNLVQIAHNVVVGEGCVIVAQVGIAGSTTIGDYCVLGGQAGIAGHLTLGKGVQVAGQSGVMNNIEPGKAVGGSPAIAIKDWHRQTVLFKRILEERKNAT